MKISLVGLANCGKTSIYSIAFAEKSVMDCRNLSPTILYEVHKHPFLGLQLAIFDFGGQEAHRKEYLEDSYLFNKTTVLIPVVDLHEPTQFGTVKRYFEEILDVYCKNNEKPKIFLLLHKFDIEDYDRDLLESNLEDAKGIFFNLFKEYDFSFAFTSIFDQVKLTKIFRDILINSFSQSKSHIEKAESQLKEIKAQIIITDISGNIITHNFSGISSGLILRADLRYFMDTCNKIRENIIAHIIICANRISMISCN